MLQKHRCAKTVHKITGTPEKKNWRRENLLINKSKCHTRKNLTFRSLISPIQLTSLMHNNCEIAH